MYIVSKYWYFNERKINFYYNFEFNFFFVGNKKCKLYFLRLKINLNNYEVCFLNVLVY